MEKNKENVLGCMIFVGLISHYLFGYFLWDKILGDMLYSITAYFCMDVFGLTTFILAKTRFLKGLGCLGIALGTYYFYMEFNSPYNWEVNDYKGLATLGISGINLFFIWFYTDILKNIKR